MPTRVIVLMLWALALGAPPAAAQGPGRAGTADERPARSVLILHSLEPENRYSSLQEEGIRAALSSATDLELEIRTRHLGLRGEIDAAQISALRAGLRESLLTREFDLILTIDSAALRVMTEGEDELLPGVPVVFSAARPEVVAELRTARPRTGVTEELDVRGTLDLMRRVLPGMRRVVVICSSTPYGDRLRDEVDAALRASGRGLEVEWIRTGEPSDVTLKEIAERLAAQGPGTGVLYCYFLWYRSVPGGGTAMEYLARASAAPIFGLYDSQLERGIVGGRLASGRALGERAGEMALRILRGEDASAIPVERGAATTMFNYPALERWNIRDSALPAGAIVVNRPRSIIEEKPGLVAVLLLALVVQGTIIAVMVRLRQRERGSRLALAESERRARLVSSLVSDMVVSRRVEPDGSTPIEWTTGRFESLMGITPSQYNALGGWASHTHPEDIEAARERHRRLLAGEAVEGEVRILRPDGLVRWLSVASFPEMDPRTGRVVRIIGAARDISQRKADELRRAFMVRELDHRVKNNMAAVLSIAEQTLRDAPSIAAFREVFSGRLRALARVHETLAARKWQGAEVLELCAAALGPYGGPAGARTSATGPSVVLEPGPAQNIALALHELATNAAKHGALSAEGGSVDITWEVDAPAETIGSGESAPANGSHRSAAAAGSPRDRARLRLRWRERGGPAPAAEPREGFGLGLIRGSITHGTGGAVDMRFEPQGLVCELTLPLAGPRPGDWAPPALPTDPAEEAAPAGA